MERAQCSFTCKQCPSLKGGRARTSAVPWPVVSPISYLSADDNLHITDHRGKALVALSRKLK